MITAIDFGCSRIRSAFRNPEHPERLSLFAERCEYALLRNTEPHRRTLEERQISYAVCEDSLAVVGNQAEQVRWLSRLPCTPLICDGVIPADDPPARQMVHLLVQAILPEPSGSLNLCAITLPGTADETPYAIRNREFLCRLVQMAGYEPLIVNPAEAANLAAGSSTAFSGISIVMGAESTEICISRLGRALGTLSLDVGSNWIDSEISRQFRVHSWDEDGACYLDLENVRAWKQRSEINLRHAMGERERMMLKLYTVVLDRVTRAIVQLLSAESLRGSLQNQRLGIMLSGGAVKTAGFASLLTERLIEHQIADRILAVRIAPDPDIAVVRGALIFAELEARSRAGESVAA